MAPKMNYDKIPTEKLNPRSTGLDRMSVLQAARLMNREDAGAVRAVSRVLPAVARAVALISTSLSRGGRLFFVGAGTSGRLGILEAAECPPTFDTPRSLIQALMAGGKSSVFRSKEGAEDRGEDAARAIRRLARRGDVVVGIAASGVTAFAGSALKAARSLGARSILVTCNPTVPKSLADVVIAADSGPEVLSGSTRLKAGTATKMILNMLTTLAMVRLGKTYGNYMVDLQPRSAKLVARGKRLVRLLGGVDESAAARLFASSGGRVKTAILMARKKVSRKEAEKRLSSAGGFLGRALGLLLLLSAASQAAVLTGLDVLEKNNFAPLAGKRVGIICNHTAVDARGRHLVDVLKASGKVELAVIFAPEHGFAGTLEHGKKVEDGRTADGIPIVSLYGAAKAPTPESLRGLDVLVFDMQDVGARFYTYITTMGLALEAAAKAGIEFMVLDRPNPARGDVVEGEILSDSVRHFTAYYSIPVRHGLTVGEIARWHNRAVGWTRLTVVPMEGWRRSMTWKETGLAFQAPSPNIRTPLTALLYTGIGAFESTNVAVGRGTSRPFEQFGAPWMNGKAVAARLAAAKLPGVRFEPVAFVPAKDRYLNERCSGVRIHVTDERKVRPVDIFARAAFLLREMYRDNFEPRWPEMPRVTGGARFENLMKSAASVEDYLALVHADAERFAAERKAVLLYE